MILELSGIPRVNEDEFLAGEVPELHGRVKGLIAGVPQDTSTENWILVPCSCVILRRLEEFYTFST